jgi:hypothetical protein
VSVQSESIAARHDIHHARQQIADTIGELEASLSAPVRAVKSRLDVRRLAQEHPWPALAIALGAGALVATSGADARVVTLTVEKAHQGAERAREGGVAGLRMARELPSMGRDAIGSVVDVLAARLAMTIIDALREPSDDGTTRTDR